jgi:hypothetical protein
MQLYDLNGMVGIIPHKSGIYLGVASKIRTPCKTDAPIVMRGR